MRCAPCAGISPVLLRAESAQEPVEQQPLRAPSSRAASLRQRIAAAFAALVTLFVGIVLPPLVMGPQLMALLGYCVVRRIEPVRQFATGCGYLVMLWAVGAPLVLWSSGAFGARSVRDLQVSPALAALCAGAIVPLLFTLCSGSLRVARELFARGQGFLAGATIAAAGWGTLISAGAAGLVVLTAAGYRRAERRSVRPQSRLACSRASASRSAAGSRSFRAPRSGD